MSDLKSQLVELQERFEKAYFLVNLPEIKSEIIEKENQMTQPDFWQDQQRAKQIAQELSDLKREVTQWEDFKKQLSDMSEILELDLDDQSVNLREDFMTQLQTLEKQFNQMELDLFLGGEYDKQSAVISIYAGTGGTDAQDWAEMLLRMYLRFCEQRNWKTEIINISEGNEAGIKSVQIEVVGRYAYGYLKSEAGVHRLVRISPFDAEKMRHTSFAMVEVLPLFDAEVVIDINPEDLKIDTFRAGGHGGQSVNTTDSAVRIKHEPTGIVVQCQNERSQMQNKEKALKILQAKLKQYYETEVEEERQKLRGEFTEAAWGNQARSYVLHPYKMVKDHRTDAQTADVERVLDGDLILFIEAYLRQLQK